MIPNNKEWIQTTRNGRVKQKIGNRRGLRCTVEWMAMNFLLKMIQSWAFLFASRRMNELCGGFCCYRFDSFLYRKCCSIHRTRVTQCQEIRKKTMENKYAGKLIVVLGCHWMCRSENKTNAEKRVLNTVCDGSWRKFNRPIYAMNAQRKDCDSDLSD